MCGLVVEDEVVTSLLDFDATRASLYGWLKFGRVVCTCRRFLARYRLREGLSGVVWGGGWCRGCCKKSSLCGGLSYCDRNFLSDADIFFEQRGPVVVGLERSTLLWILVDFGRLARHCRGARAKFMRSSKVRFFCFGISCRNTNHASHFVDSSRQHKLFSIAL